MLEKFNSNKFLKVSIILIILLSLGFIGYKRFYKTSPASNATVTLLEERVQMGDITIGFTGDGKAEIPVVKLDFEISGKLKELYVKEGELIQEGQLLAKLDDTELQNKLRISQINYNKALGISKQKEENLKLNIQSEKQKLDDLGLKLKQIEVEYLPMVHLQDYYSKQELEMKKLSYESAKDAYDVQVEKYNSISNSNIEIELEKINVESAKINLEMAMSDLENTILKSPVTATVIYVSNKPGETVSAGKDTGSVTADTASFMIVSEADKVEVIVPISEIDMPKVQVGQTAEVNFEAYDREKFIGKVISINSLPRTDQSGIVSYDVKIELDGTEKIKTGMTCSITFIVRQQKNVLKIPNKAVSVVEGKQTVKVKDGNGDIEIRNIKTGLTDGKSAEVVEGLNVGETILIENKK